MYLKALEINGYKSFAKKAHFDFSSRISAIVGPNGSGKSNVAEAFRFVLGEQSFKNMRSKKGSDLLFAGKAGQINRAWVSVTLDNSDKTLNIDYHEVVITRTVLRDGNNEYQINGNTVRAKDVVELLAGANIGSSGHHIISQGEADKILTLSARDRKGLVEEALGLKVYTIKKQEAERKLAKTSENLQEVKNQERANTPRLHELKRKVEKIQEARELRKTLSDLYSKYLPGKHTIIQELEKARVRRQEITKELEHIVSHLKNLEVDNEPIKESSEKQDTQSAQVILEQELRELRSAKARCDKIIAQMEARIEFAEAQVAEAHKVALGGKDKRDAIARKLYKLVNDWVRARLDLLKLDYEARQVWEDMLGEYDSLSEEARSEYHAQAQEIIDNLTGTHSSVSDKGYEAQIEEHRAVFKAQEAERAELEQSEKKLLAEIDTLRAKQISPTQAKQELQIKRLELQQDQSEAQHEVEEINRIIGDLEHRLGEYEAEEAEARALFGHQVDEIMSHAQASTSLLNIESDIREEIIKTRTLIAYAGAVGGEEVIEEYTKRKKEAEYIASQLADLEESMAQLEALIKELELQLDEKFRRGLEQINSSFNTFFQTLFSGGSAGLREVEVPVRTEEDVYELGIEMQVSLPNKKISTLDMLSGGERSLTSIALLFAMSQVAPPPFIILDETDAALDEANSKRYSDMIEQLAEHSQLILITHNRETMSRAGVLYGVTMGSDGVSRLLSVSLDEASMVAK
ncbi:MAG: chromosome segregation SMC family protein [Patescibacteria group bacterium]